MSSPYPTKDEILNNMRPADTVAVAIVNAWKSREYNNKWDQQSPENKMDALEILANDLWAWLGKDVEQTGFDLSYGVGLEWGDQWNYNPTTHVIQGDKNSISILSLLHEVGHAIGGMSELQACVFSIGLFMECFPVEYNELRWEGHQLKRA